MTITTPAQFKEARQTLGLTLKECGAVCNVNPRTIRKWEADPSVKSSRPPHPSACRIMEIELERMGKK